MFTQDQNGLAVGYECGHGYDSQCCGVERSCPEVGVAMIELFNRLHGKI